MIRFARAVLSAITIWIYYRWGWVRAVQCGVRVSWSARISPYAKLHGVVSLGDITIGKNVIIDHGSYAGSGVIDNVKIGPYVSIGPDVIIGPSEHRLDYWTTSPYEAIYKGFNRNETEEPVKTSIINKGVWVGARVIILQGVTIGERAVVAAGSVVVCDVPCNEVWGGVPARKIKNRTLPSEINNEN